MNLSIGVAIATCNGGNYIADQLNSIINQNCCVDFISISDDASSDNTIAVARNILSACRINYKIVINNTRIGVIKNFIQAFSACDTDYIAYCDQDDVWCLNKIKLIKKEILKSGVSLVFHKSILVDADLNILHSKYSVVFKDGKYNTPHIPNVIYGWGHQYIFSKAVRNLLIDMISFNRDGRADYLNNFDKSLLYAAGFVGNIVFLDKGLTYFRRHSSSVSNAGKSTGALNDFDISRLKKINSFIITKYNRELDEINKTIGDVNFIQKFITQNNTKLQEFPLSIGDYSYAYSVLLNKTKTRLNIYTSKSFKARLFAIFTLVLQGGYGSIFKNRLPLKWFLKDIVFCIFFFKKSS